MPTESGYNCNALCGLHADSCLLAETGDPDRGGRFCCACWTVNFWKPMDVERAIPGENPPRMSEPYFTKTHRY